MRNLSRCSAIRIPHSAIKLAAGDGLASRPCSQFPENGPSLSRLADAPPRSPSKGDVRLLDDLANWWPARVTLPVPRIKSPLYHFNACRLNSVRQADSSRRSRRRRKLGERRLVLAEGFAPALATLSTSGLCRLDYASGALYANGQWQRANRPRKALPPCLFSAICNWRCVIASQALEPPAGAAPARLAYKESLQAAARRRSDPSSRQPQRSGSNLE